MLWSLKPLCLRVNRRAFSTATQAALSTVHKGIAFENRSLYLLQDHLSMSLSRVGGKGDGGIDLLGWWWLPALLGPPVCDSRAAAAAGTTDWVQNRRRLRVIAQCKDEKKKTGPKYVRELEGVLYRYVSKTRPDVSPDIVPDALNNGPTDGLDLLLNECTDTGNDAVIGLLISSAPFTKATLLRAHSSPMPMMLLHIPAEQVYSPAESRSRSSEKKAFSPDHDVEEPMSSEQHEEASGTFGALVFNPALGSASGLLRGQIEARWEYHLTSPGSGRPSLWWDGRRMQSWTPEKDCYKMVTV